jgi:PAS domain S-box-containing protein
MAEQDPDTTDGPLSRTARLRGQIAALERRLAEAELGPVGAVEGEARARALRERETLLAEAERVAQMGTWVWDVANETADWSEQLYRILGRERGGAAPRIGDLFEAVHSDDRQRVRNAVEYGARSGITRSLEYRVLRADGSLREVVMDGAVVRDGEGRVVRYVGSILDLTDRRRAERELERSESLLREAQRIAQVGSWVWDFASHRVEWSEELFRILGLSRETEPTLERYLALIHAEDRRRAADLTRRAVETGAGEPVEFRIVRPADGAVRHVYAQSRAIHDEDGDITGLVGTVLDVTDRRQLEAQLHQAHKMEAVGRLAGGVAHDFNNLLTAIRFYVDLLEQKSPGEELRHIAAAVETAASLTRQLLAFSRQAVVKPELLDLNAITRDAVRLIRRVIGEDVEIRLELGPDIWSVLADSGQLQQVLLNLAVNARDAMPSGGVLEIATDNVRVDAEYRSRHPEATPGDHLRLIVRDTGTGMDEATRARVFEPFFTTKEPGKGTGLGLATVFGIVTQSGGTIDLRSELGAGTTIVIHLPRAGGGVQARKDQPRGIEEVPGGSEAILLVEDDRAICDVMTRVLKDAGYVVYAANRPAQAFEIWGDHGEQIAAVVSDVVLPDMSGPELLQRLGSPERRPPVLFVTGYAPGVSGAYMGAPHLAKPFRPAALLRAVRELLDKRPRR